MTLIISSLRGGDTYTQTSWTEAISRNQVRQPRLLHAWFKNGVASKMKKIDFLFGFVLLSTF